MMRINVITYLGIIISAKKHKQNYAIKTHKIYREWEWDIA